MHPTDLHKSTSRMPPDLSHSVHEADALIEPGDSHSNLTVPQRIAASSLGGLLTAVTMTPFDVVKTRLQAQTRPGAVTGSAASRCFLYCNGLMDLQLCAVNAYHSARSSACATRETRMVPNFCRHQYNTSSAYQGSWDAALRIARSEGPLALWRGLSASLALTVPGTVIYFTTLDLLKWHMDYRSLLCKSGEISKNKDWVPPLAAGAARVTAVLCLSPLELARTKMQAEGLGWTAIGRAASLEVGRSGLLSLWRGLPPTLMRDVPFSAIYWFTYDGLRARLLAAKAQARESQQQAGLSRRLRTASTSSTAAASPILTGPEAAAFGCVAGAVAGLTTHPFDVLKTHRQVEFAGSLGGVRRTPGTVDSMRLLMTGSSGHSRGGHRALYAGLVPRLLKVVPASAIMVATFELLKNEFSERNSRSALAAMA
ncbi:hypothetical protein BOX15_Mlig005912g1 [Macrostomum lignano]|uniref:Uncharacterized protein n=2 Tax=Macrostomum lignano TaxID=282301 RepID=A0A267EXY7_9PLAT|nr:hypothetical protein BOX15_Mlig005912g1 [Macrostomum lignano]